MLYIMVNLLCRLLYLTLMKSVVVANFPVREKAGNKFDNANSNCCGFLLKNGWFC